MTALHSTFGCRPRDGWGRRVALLVVLGLWAAAAYPVFASQYGRVTGTVTDAEGKPLMGATVLIMGPALAGSYELSDKVRQVITDAQGRFVAERLLPGHYALRVTSPRAMPVLRSGVRVEPGQTAQLSVILTDIFEPFRLKLPGRLVTTRAGDEWKWVLRTSAASRPVLRYKKERGAGPDLRIPASSQRMIAMLPGPRLDQPLAGDSGMGGILAYSRSLSEDTDLLVAGSMASDGMFGSSLLTAVRRNVIHGNPQELALVVHQLNFGSGPRVIPVGEANLANAQGVVVSYAGSRLLSPTLTLTTGFEMDYLNAMRGALAFRPKAKLSYQVSPASTLTVRYGAVPLNTDGSLLERVGALTAFPRVTARDGRPVLEGASHAEVSYERRVGRTGKVQVAAYHDHFQDAVVRAFGGPQIPAGTSGSVLPNTTANGLNLNAGDYGSSGVRAAATKLIGQHLEAAVLYTNGRALAVRPAASSAQGKGFALVPEQSQSIAGKLIAEVPRTKTRIVTSYEYVGGSRVTEIDPYGQAGFELDPYLGIEIRQPLPAVSFIPAHVEALADFRNLLGQGYSRLPAGCEQSFFLTSAYRSFRGGFSVQF